MRFFNIVQGQQAYKLLFETYGQNSVTDFDLDAFKEDLGGIEVIMEID